MVPITLVALRRAFGLDVRQLVLKIARIALSGAVMVCAVLLARFVLPVSPWAIAGEVVAGSVVYAVVLESLFLRGHLARILTIVRGAIPAFSS